VRLERNKIVEEATEIRIEAGRIEMERDRVRWIFYIKQTNKKAAWNFPQESVNNQLQIKTISPWLPLKSILHVNPSSVKLEIPN
jgi:hypothetical protein